MSKNNSADLAKLFGLLGEPTRMAIVELLKGQSLSVGEIAKQLEIRQPQVSKHLKVLTEANFLKVQAKANKRIYSLRIEKFQILEIWAQMFIIEMQDKFDTLDDYLIEIQNKNNL